jgi:hypothetical protein
MTTRKRKSSFTAGLALLVVIVALGIAGTMEYEDAQKVEEFRREYRPIVDAQGSPRVVLASEVADAQTTRQSHPLRAVREPGVSALAAR